MLYFLFLELDLNRSFKRYRCVFFLIVYIDVIFALSTLCFVKFVKIFLEVMGFLFNL